MSLKQLVNNKQVHDALMEELKNRISEVHTMMEQATDAPSMYRLQGSVASLRKLLNLREKVNADG